MPLLFIRSLLARLGMLVALCIAGTAIAQEQDQAPNAARFVTDGLRLEARNGPGLNYRVRKMLDSGTRVEALDEREGYTQIRLADGTELWMLSRYLLDQPPARDRIAGVTAELEAAVARIAELEQDIVVLRDANEAGAREREALLGRERALAGELVDVRNASASALETRERNERLKERAESLEAELAQLREDAAVLRGTHEREWLLAGAGVLLGGIVLGVVLPHMRLRRQRSAWSDL